MFEIYSNGCYFIAKSSDKIFRKEFLTNSSCWSNNRRKKKKKQENIFINYKRTLFLTSLVPQYG